MRIFEPRSGRQRGFTLIELMLVIAIAGLVIAGGTAAYHASEAKKRDIKRLANIREVQKALALYLNQVGSYPVEPAGVCIDGSAADTVTTALRARGAVAGTAKFNDPAWPDDPAKCYLYTSAGGDTYTIRYVIERDSDYAQEGTYTAAP